MKYFVSLLLLVILISCQRHSEDSRLEMDLNGEWDIAESIEPDKIPTTFPGKIPVPGIVSMAHPPFDSTGARATHRNYYWYKRTFSLEEDSKADVALLKINKAKYGTKVYVNGQDAGYNPWCVTPSYFNLKPYLNPSGQENELLVRIGATEFDIPDSIPNDRTDLEKKWHFAGIYDDVKLILSGYPYIENIQIAPDIVKSQIRVVAEIRSDQVLDNFSLNYSIKEHKTGKRVASGKTPSTNLNADLVNKLDFTIALPGASLWTPEDPFLYTLEVRTARDSKVTRFGMRSFTFDPEKKMALLNGEPYAMLGTNVTIFRFFEDENRGTHPWDKKWVKKLHLSFKEMNWNSMRYSLGFPPEIWYDIADETGFLIQDEYLYWYQYGVFAPSLEVEFERWMRERWNHPSVVIWDAQNETVSQESGKAIAKVRSLDLSNRPWDNGFSPPDQTTDPIEAHPYLFYNYSRGEVPSEEGYMVDFFDTLRYPHNDPNEHAPREDGSRYENAIIINEYDWLWLNRDGTPTTLTDKVYATVWGKNLSPAERFEIRAQNVGILTEYWRCHRMCAGIMHFCGLGYSRADQPRGQTSDIFLDVEELVIEPNLLKYVKPKFAPVCIMIDQWKKTYSVGKSIEVPIYAINDYPKDWSGDISLRLHHPDGSVSEQSQRLLIDENGQEVVNFDLALPSEEGVYQLIAEVILPTDTVRSYRSFNLE